MNIPYTKHIITEKDISAVEQVLKNGPLTNGPQVAKFEERFREFVNAPHSVAVSSGTAALHLAVTALGIKPGQTVLLPSLTFAATANAVLYQGGKIEFVDIDPRTYLVNIDIIEQKIKNNPQKYAGVIAVDFAGLPVHAPQLSELCKTYGLWLIEDAAHALGASFSHKNKKIMVGGSQYADATIFSFHPAKHITTGEGGMVTTRHEGLSERIRLLRSHAMNKDKIDTSEEPWRYSIEELGYNYRMSDINAALGISQLERLTQNISARQKIAKKYKDNLKGINASFQLGQTGTEHAYHLFVIQTLNRGALFNHLKEQGIFAQVHYVPLHMQQLYSEGVEPDSLLQTEKYYRHCLSIPMFPTLTASEQDYIIKCLNDFVAM